jgi:hypothetical protein
MEISHAWADRQFGAAQASYANGAAAARRPLITRGLHQSHRWHRQSMTCYGDASRFPPHSSSHWRRLYGGHNETGEALLIITSENLDRIQGFDREIEKERLELFHLECFQADHVLQTGRTAFDSVKRGMEPPDFVAAAGSDHVGVDCAA